MQVDQRQLFEPISAEVVAELRRDTLNLHSSFKLSLNGTQQQIEVALTSRHLAICQRLVHDYNYLYYTEINFQLKFEVLHIQGQPRGFRLIRQGSTPVQLEIAEISHLPVWLKCLSRLINQLGFHALFKPMRKLGKGGFATVYEVERLSDGKLFAVKAFSKQHTLLSQNPSHRLNLLNELAMLRAVDHPNLIRLEGVFESDNSLYVVLQLLREGHLHNQINKRGGQYSLPQVRKIITGLLRGLKHLENLGILHRDLKPENIMLRKDCEPVLVDFGLATHAQADDYIFYRCGTPGYVAPEVTTLVKGQKISPVCDVFSAGIILHILLTARPLFAGRKFEEVYDNNKNLRFDLNTPAYRNIDPSAMDLLKRMLCVDPRSRITASLALEHPFVCWLQQQKPSPVTTLHLKQVDPKHC